MRTPPYTFRFNPKSKAELEKIAKADNRSLGYVLNIIVAEYLASQPKPKRR